MSYSTPEGLPSATPQYAIQRKKYNRCARSAGYRALTAVQVGHTQYCLSGTAATRVSVNAVNYSGSRTSQGDA